MTVNLLDFSNEILLHIFQFVSATDLYQLSFVCERLNDVVKDEHLWTWCEGRHTPNTLDKIRFCEGGINNRTRAVMLAGSNHCNTVISNDFLQRAVHLKSLTVLALENQYLNGSDVPLIKYPSQLRELSFNNSYVTDYKEFFKQCSTVLKKLRVLILDRCNWFDSYFLLAVSKLESLEILSLYLCKQLTDFDISYISLAGAHGFRTLKILDVRFTGYGDEVIKSFCRNKSVREIYYQGYARTFQLECAKRRLDILNGAADSFKNYINPYMQVDDTNARAMMKIFGDDFTLTCLDMQRVTDKGVRNYAWLHINLTEEYIPPKSVLYTHPYGECTCGFMKPKKEKIETLKSPPNVDTESYKLQRECVERKIRKLTNRKVTPDVFFLEMNRSVIRMDDEPSDWSWMGKREPETLTEIFTLQHMSPLLYHHIMSISDSSEPVFDVIEVDLSRNVVRLMPRGIVQNSFVIEPNPPADGEVNPIPPRQPQGVKRKHADDKKENGRVKQRKIDEPCCSKSLKPPDEAKRVSDDSFKDKIKSLNGILIDESSSEDEDEVGNSVALGNEEEACANAEEAKDKPANGDERPEDKPVAEVERVVRIEPAPPVQENVPVLPQRVENLGVNLAMPRIPVEVFLLPRGGQRLIETGIRSLSLRGYDKVTDHSLRHLEYMRLDLLDVTSTGVTDAGVEQFRSTNPHCRVIHETACKCRPRLHF